MSEELDWLYRFRHFVDDYENRKVIDCSYQVGDYDEKGRMLDRWADRAVVTSASGVPLSHREWKQLRKEIDALYRETTPEQMDELRAEITDSGMRRQAWRKAKDQAVEKAKSLKKDCGVYLVGGYEDGLYKIGRSIKVVGRFRALLDEVERPLQLLHVIPVEGRLQPQAEAWFHQKFEASRQWGERFALSPEEIQWFCSLERLEWRQEKPPERGELQG